MIATTHERQRFNSMAPNGPGKSAVGFPRCQYISDPIESLERFTGGNTLVRYRDDRTERCAKSQRTQHLAASRAERRSAEQRERNIRPKLQRVRHLLHIRHS